MNNFNYILLSGNATTDGEFGYSAKGTAVLRFSIANNDNNETSFFKCVVFNKYAEALKDVVKKGSMLFIQGKIKMQNWTDKNSNKRIDYSVIVSSLYAINKKNSDCAPVKQGKTNIITHQDVLDENYKKDQPEPYNPYGQQNLVDEARQMFAENNDDQIPF